MAHLIKVKYQQGVEPVLICDLQQINMSDLRLFPIEKYKLPNVLLICN